MTSCSDDDYSQGMRTTEAELVLDVFGAVLPGAAPQSPEVFEEALRRSMDRLEHVELLKELMLVYARMLVREQNRMAVAGERPDEGVDAMLARSFLAVLGQLMQHGVVGYDPAFIESLEEYGEDDE
jgi:hypothetical protein